MSTTPTSDFSQPIYMDEPAAGAGHSHSHSNASGAGSGSSSSSSLDSTAVVDLNDPNLLLGEFDSNAHLNAYDAPPPPPDGRYTVKLKQLLLKGENNQQVEYKVKPGKDGKPPYVNCGLEAAIVDNTGKFDGIKLYDYLVTSRPNRAGAVPLVRILTCLGVKLPAKINAKILVDQFKSALASEPLLDVDVAWEGQVDQADSEAFQQIGKYAPTVRGMNRFPDDGKGGKVPEMVVDTELGRKQVRAQARITNYHPKGSKK